MQKFIVPQFIDVESKIFGPITTRQFLIGLVGLMFGFVSYKLSDFSLFIVEAVIIGIATVAFAFIKVNGAPFHIFMLNYIKTMKSAKVRIWKRQAFVKQTQKETEENINDNKPVSARRQMSASRLSELSLIIDTGGAYQGEDVLRDNLDNEPINIDKELE
ncbi:PrgI family protein [Patescibacteria group bacterium]|nr:PrgI family protein [Patescibacteria group bacterium]